MPLLPIDGLPADASRLTLKPSMLDGAADSAVVDAIKLKFDEEDGR